ncbi:hypothetical protein Q7C36_012110 [Tachysurus vachellii]|uniref:Uncharacterized protein n=1 Tax=Tachysurus vachellii TaxID=175792 RepID=A0AA88MVF1_TACVA|nr:hypothetical protein Q7C36_012110 [Tachysurus vachellii]
MERGRKPRPSQKRRHYIVLCCWLHGRLAGEPSAPEVPGLEEEASAGQTDGDAKEVGPFLRTPRTETGLLKPVTQ